MKRQATRAGRARTAPWRAITAVIALYAFVLHAVLGLAVPASFAADHGVLCLGQVDAEAPGATQAESPASRPHAHPPCCTVPAPALDALAPEPEARPVAWPPRIASRVAWRSVTPLGARAPPGTIARPRGPPIV